MDKIKESIEQGTISIDHIISIANDHQMAFALWRLPETAKTYLILTREPIKIKGQLVLEDCPSGFVFAPFDKSLEKIFLPGDYTFLFENDVLLPPESPQQTASHEWLKEGTKINSSKPKQSIPLPAIFNVKESEKESFENLVKKGVCKIENGLVEKVVLSRCKLISLPERFDPVSTFQKLCRNYAAALIYYVHIPKMSSWMGATPETLVRLEGNMLFRTTALAGTQPYIAGMNVRSVAWTQKEIEEHALVERYIISCFKKIRLREYEEYGPKTIVAGNLMHLKSDFIVDLQATNFPQLGTVMLDLLHPTSAVCGSPLDASLQFIKENEGYDRTYYTGYLGPINVQSHTDIFVNLRCMQLFTHHALLYAGAGITSDSQPEKEWEETEMKLRTLLKVIE